MDLCPPEPPYPRSIFWPGRFEAAVAQVAGLLHLLTSLRTLCLLNLAGEVRALRKEHISIVVCVQPRSSCKRLKPCHLQGSQSSLIPTTSPPGRRLLVALRDGLSRCPWLERLQVGKGLGLMPLAFALRAITRALRSFFRDMLDVTARPHSTLSSHRSPFPWVSTAWGGQRWSTPLPTAC